MLGFSQTFLNYMTHEIVLQYTEMSLNMCTKNVFKFVKSMIGEI